MQQGQSVLQYMKHLQVQFTKYFHSGTQKKMIRLATRYQIPKLSTVDHLRKILKNIRNRSDNVRNIGSFRVIFGTRRHTSGNHSQLWGSSGFSGLKSLLFAYLHFHCKSGSSSVIQYNKHIVQIQYILVQICIGFTNEQIKIVLTSNFDRPTTSNDVKETLF